MPLLDAALAGHFAEPILSASDLASIESAIRDEIAAAHETVKTSWLDIDGIEHSPDADAPGKFVYRLTLSSPVHFSADQTVTFQSRNPKESIAAVIVRFDDDGLVVECQKPLPTDAKLLSLTFDPTFILRALEKFFIEQTPKGGPIARLVVNKTIPPPSRVNHRPYPGLNDDQALAVEEMASTPLHLLWGPPGTGKTTTVAAAAVRWLRQKKTVLIVSTSNAAVDVAMRAVLKGLRLDERRFVLRLGTSLDPHVREITLGGKLAAQQSSLSRSVLRAQGRLREIRETLQSRTLAHERLQSLFSEASELERQIEEFNKRVSEAAPRLSTDVLVTGCTLAKMVLDQDLRHKQLDVVIVDEVSMASLLYAFAASLLPSCHLVYAGDPQQLPPIVQAEGRNAARWFGQSIYDWFDVHMDGDVPATKLSLLRTQYRMTNQIGSVVSRLSYGDLLRHGRGAYGPRIEFIDVGDDWQTTHYSVREKSYYHLAAIPVLHALAGLIDHDELLLLTPFRPQRSLLTALIFDLRKPASGRKALASTIHRAQGSEAKAVIVDLTTHSPQQLVAFFRDKHCDKLFNVAISRAREQLIILGSQAMLRELAGAMSFWGRVVSEFGSGMDVLTVEEIIEDLDHFDALASIPLSGASNLPAIYSHDRNMGSAELGIEVLTKLTASRKLLVLPDARHTQPGTGDFIVRTSPNSPPVFVGGGMVCLPYRGIWIGVESSNVSRVLWRIGFSHLADDEVDPAQVRRFFCPECSNGELVLRQYRGEGWFLVCTNGHAHECYHRRRLSLEDAKLKVMLHGMRCPDGHPLTARSGSRSIFLGCENYPDCQFSETLAVLEGA